MSLTLRRFAPLALLSSLAAQPASGQHGFADPQGRFSLQYPTGWTANSPGPDAVSLVNKDASVTVMIWGQGDPATALSQLLDQYQSQWASFLEIKRGDISLGGQPGSYIFASGRNPKGTAGFLKLAAVASDGGTLVLLESTPQAGYATLKPTLEQIERGIVLGSPGAAASGAPSTGGYNDQTGAAAAPPAGKGFLGVGTRPVEPEDARQLGLNEPRGALVGQIYPGGPAERAGLLPGDVVIGAEGSAINQPQELVALVGAHHSGDVLTLQVFSHGQTKTVKVRLGSPPSH
jgi:hypothetical protein